MKNASRDTLDPAKDREAALKLTPVSRETVARLDRFVALVLEWQRKISLVAPSTLPHLWTRHVADSLQLLHLMPNAGRWVDFGSGGGFPAIPIACALAERPGAEVHLVESSSKKASFLREAVRRLALPAVVHVQRAEDYGENCVTPVEVVTARALAPLKTLCGLAFPLIRKGTIGLFLKGQDVGAELTEATKCWTIEATTVPSRTSREGRIVIVRGLQPRTQPSSKQLP